MELTIDQNFIKAAMCCTAHRDVRYYLNGALFEMRAGVLNVVSTDGTILSRLVVPFTANDASLIEDFAVIIPNNALKAGSKCKLVTLRKKGTEWRIGDVFFEPIAGTFPDYKRVIPDVSKQSGEVGQFDCDLLQTAQTTLREYYNTKKAVFVLRHNGTTSSAVMLGADSRALVVIMPCRV